MKLKAVTAVTHQTALVLCIMPIEWTVSEKFMAFMCLHSITNQKTQSSALPLNHASDILKCHTGPQRWKDFLHET